MRNVRTIALPGWMMLVLLAGGCMSERHPDIPSDAMMVSQGDKMLSYRTDSPGTVYVYNQNDNKMLYSGKVDAGQTISVDPAHNKITLDNQTVYDKGINGFDTRKVFFRADGTVHRTTVIEERRSN